MIERTNYIFEFGRIHVFRRPKNSKINTITSVLVAYGFDSESFFKMDDFGNMRSSAKIDGRDVSVSMTYNQKYKEGVKLGDDYSITISSEDRELARKVSREFEEKLFEHEGQLQMEDAA